MTPESVRLSDVFRAIDLISERLRWSLREDAMLFPVDPSALDNHEAARSLDAFLKRFEQSCDHLLRKLFPALVAAAEADPSTHPLLDVLDRLHRQGVIDSPATWLGINNLRNRLVHDYALDRPVLARELTAAWNAAPTILDQIATARAYASEHGLLAQG